MTRSARRFGAPLRPARRRRRPLWALGLAVLLAGAASAEEQRCRELGSACICSEPLASPQRAIVGHSQDPGDSTTKQCDDGTSVTSRAPRPVRSRGLGLPAQARISHVWEDSGSHGGAVVGVSPEQPGTRRICARYYVRYSDDYQFQSDGSCRAGKLTQIDLGTDLSSAPLHAEAKSDQWRIVTQGLGGSAMRASGGPGPEGCRGDWCRVELCLSGDIATGRDLYLDGYVENLDTGERAVWQREYRGSTPDGGGVHRDDGVWLMSLYREGSCRGRRWFTHVMQAEWSRFDPAEPGPYIGAAPEIEGDAPPILTCGADADCDDGLFCNGRELCAAGVCVSARTGACDDGVPCTADSCDEAGATCDNAPDDRLCDNGLFCDGAEFCARDGCRAGSPVTCRGGPTCAIGTCDESRDSCRYAPDHAACDDGAFCDGAERCDLLLGCRPGNAVVCNDGLACTADSCNEATNACEAISEPALCAGLSPAEVRRQARLERRELRRLRRLERSCEAAERREAGRNAGRRRRGLPPLAASPKLQSCRERFP